MSAYTSNSFLANLKYSSIFLTIDAQLLEKNCLKAIRNQLDKLLALTPEQNALGFFAQKPQAELTPVKANHHINLGY